MLRSFFVCVRSNGKLCTPRLRQGSPTSRLLGTFFGKVRYWRTYLYRNGEGYYPLDVELGLTGDGFSMMVQSYATRIATKVSYAQTVLVLILFLSWAPAQRSIENMVLGLGRHTTTWFESAPAPEGDGEVLVIQMDSKANPTATEEELEKRRGKRAVNPHPGSQRHRGRTARQRRGPKRRHKKGDKSKNGKIATIVVMYTLKQSADDTLEGPINKRFMLLTLPNATRLPSPVVRQTSGALDGRAGSSSRLLPTGTTIWSATLRNSSQRQSTPLMSTT